MKINVLGVCSSMRVASYSTGVTEALTESCKTDGEQIHLLI